ncbi:bglB, partial [Symbiodinium pilosum]
LVANMTLSEKLSMLHGSPDGRTECMDSPGCAYVGNIAPVERLRIPPVNMNDGPQGYRAPAALAGTSTEWGQGMGKEFYDKGSNLQLGEDPYLGYRLVQPVVRGIQSQKVVANAKHFIQNNQETNRVGVSAEVDERTRFEMYYPPFEGAVQAGVGSMMCSYNKVNGDWSCENPFTLRGDLKQTLNYQGYVMSDWGATHSMSIAAGLDVEQPGAFWMNAELIQEALDAGTVKESQVDDSVRRILQAMFQVGVMDEPLSAWDWSKRLRNVTTAASVASARRLSAKGTVLLRNEGNILPLTRGKRVAVIGLADAKAIYHAGGSGSVQPSSVSTPLQGFRDAVGDSGTVEFNCGRDVNAAVELAKQSDYAVIFVGTLSREDFDRSSLSLDVGVDWTGQNEAVSAIAAAAGEKTVVVVTTPGAVLLPWSRQVAAIITNFMPGQQAGNAVADILFGNVNPSGKLPVTFPNRDNETEFSPAQYPGIPDPKAPAYAFYTEKLQIGYRFYETHRLQFQTGFPFGHGLSYTSFAYSNLEIRDDFRGGKTVAFVVKNTGGRPGAEVAQLYLEFPASAGEPFQLKGFAKTKLLDAGEDCSLALNLRPRDLSIWDTDKHSWRQIGGVFGVSVGSSSRDIRLHEQFSTNIFV